MAAGPREDPSGEAVLGEVVGDRAPSTTPVEHDDEMRLVKVRSRVNIEPFKFGKKTYAVQKNKETLLPLCVRSHLEEKGIL